MICAIANNHNETAVHQHGQRAAFLTLEKTCVAWWKSPWFQDLEFRVGKCRFRALKSGYLLYTTSFRRAAWPRFEKQDSSWPPRLRGIEFVCSGPALHFGLPWFIVHVNIPKLQQSLVLVFSASLSRRSFYFQHQHAPTRITRSLVPGVETDIKQPIILDKWSRGACWCAVHSHRNTQWSHAGTSGGSRTVVVTEAGMFSPWKTGSSDRMSLWDLTFTSPSGVLLRMC